MTVAASGQALLSCNDVLLISAVSGRWINFTYDVSGSAHISWRDKYAVLLDAVALVAMDGAAQEVHTYTAVPFFVDGKLQLTEVKSYLP